MPLPDRFISVVAPFHNATAYLAGFVEDLTAVLSQHCRDYEIILIDDGSTDAGTADVCTALLKRHRALRLLTLSRPYGHEIAVSAGLESVIGDYVIVMDPATDPPEIVPEVVELALSGADLVYGTDRNPRKRSLFSRLAANVFHWYAKRYLRIEIPRNLTTLRCFSRYAVNAMTRLKESHQHYRYFGSLVGFQSAVYHYASRVRAGAPAHAKRRFGAELNEAVDIIVENSPHPLRFFSLLALIVAFGNLAYIGYVVTIYFVLDHVAEGWTTLSLQVSVLFLCVITILAAMSEYVGRVLDKLKGRPSYYVRDERNSAVMITDERLNVTHRSDDVDVEREVR